MSPNAIIRFLLDYRVEPLICGGTGKLRRAGMTRDLIQTVYAAGSRLNAETGDHLQESVGHNGGGIQASRAARFDNAEYKEKSA